MNRRLAVMEAQQTRTECRGRVDLGRLNEDDVETLERLALDRQAWPGAMADWLVSLATEEHDDLMRLHALARSCESGIHGGQDVAAGCSIR